MDVIERALWDMREWIVADIALAAVSEEFSKNSGGYDDGYYWDRLHGSESDQVERLRLAAVASFDVAVKTRAEAHAQEGKTTDA